jgi:starch synthase
LIPQDNRFPVNTFSLTALGIYHSDVVSTVSENYAKEILTPEYGEGLAPLLQSRSERLFGIVNGIDYQHFDPSIDPVISAKYDVSHPEKRAGNKVTLQRAAGLPVNLNVPVIGMASRLVDQKGIDIAERALGRILEDTDVQFILQGSGESRYEDLLRGLEQRYEGKVRLFLTPDFSLAHLIFAGCDIFLVPSRYEPCGLTPLIAMRYGAIPVVRRTGGLAENVVDFDRNGLDGGIGFVFEHYDSEELEAALRRALSVLHNQEEWQRLVVRAMSADYSWEPSVLKYEALYEAAHSGERKTS